MKTQLTEKEARKICAEFASKHQLIFSDNGEVGFGRPCVGFLHGDNYVEHNPRDLEKYKVIPHLECEKCYAPDGVDAYHKHNCLAVLGHGEEAIKQLAEWVQHLESQGEVSVETYQTGATGIQAVFSGFTAKAIMIK